MPDSYDFSKSIKNPYSPKRQMEPTSMPVQTREEAVAAILKVLEPRADLHLAVLHGSAAAGTMRKSSDIDLAVAMDHPMSPDELLELATAVSLACGRETDIADLRSSGGLFLHRVLSKGRLVLNRNPQLYNSLALESLEFIQDIQPIVRAAQARRIKEFADGR
jgi:predicted nucleotidyltransferase